MDNTITITLNEKEANNVRLALDSFAADIVRNGNGVSDAVQYASSFHSISNRIVGSMMKANNPHNSEVPARDSKKPIIAKKAKRKRKRGYQCINSRAMNIIRNNYTGFGGKLSIKECASIAGVTDRTASTYVCWARKEANTTARKAANTPNAVL